MTNPLDGPDAEFDAAVLAFAAWLVTNFASVGLTAGQNTAIQTATTTWTTKYGALGPAEAAASIAQAEKDGARQTLRSLMAEPAKRITDAATRTAAGLNAYAERRGRVPAPTTRPVLVVDTSQRFQQTIKFSDETAPGARRKPDGVHHIELWYAIGPTPPAGPDGFEFLATDTNTPYEHYIEFSEAGKMCHTIGRWVNSRDEKGPWSETVSATITG